MRVLTAPTIAALSAPVVRFAHLLYLGFTAPNAPIALASSNFDIEWDGVTYKGAGALGAISAIDDSPGEVKGLKLELIAVDAAYLALALDDAAIVQGTPAVIRTAILDENFAAVDAPVEWEGELDTMPIEEDGDKCLISVTAESSAVDLLRGNALTYSDADQQSLYPGDLAFQFLLPQAGVRIIWPSKQWYIAVGPTR